MISSWPRYLLLAVGLPALLVNAAFNWFLGTLFHPSGAALSMGAGGVGGDTVGSAFFIGFFTWLITAPAASREARSGRVRGGGRRMPWWRWLMKRRFSAAPIIGLCLVALCAAPAMAALVGMGTQTMARHDFLIWKAAFCGVTGALSAIGIALFSIRAEGDFSDDPRWCRAPRSTQGVVYPCDQIDKGGVAISDNSLGCSVTPTWHLIVSGALEPAHVLAALSDLATRYPSLKTKVQSLDGVPPFCTRLRYAEDPGFQPRDLFEHREIGNDEEALSALDRELKNRPLDLFIDYPMTLTLATTGADICHLYFRQHHSLADGRAFIGLLGDFADYLEAARNRSRPAETALSPIGRMSELSALGLSAGQRVWWTIAGYGALIESVGRAIAKPNATLIQNRSNDYSGGNETLHWTLSDEALTEWNAARKAIGVSLNSFLTAALFMANQRWHRSVDARLGRVRGGLFMETRPRAGDFHSFANHLAGLEVTLPLDRMESGVEIARAVQRQVDEQRKAHLPYKRLLCQMQLVSAMRLDQMHDFVFQQRRPVTNLDFSNLIALGFPNLGGAGWQVEEVLITTPVMPRTGIVLTVIRHRGRLSFNFNYKQSAVTAGQVEALRGYFREAIVELGGAAHRTPADAPF